MLSIGKLKAGQARYYLDQADARVDVVDSVAEGMEDYYLGAPEARGEWLGSAALELGLSGAVEAGELRQVLAGVRPDGRITTTSRLESRAGCRLRPDFLGGEVCERAVRCRR